MLTKHEIGGVEITDIRISRLANRTTTVTIDSDVSLPFLTLSLPLSLSFSSSSRIVNPMTLAAYASRETQASRWPDTGFHGYGMIPSLREMLPILLDYVAGFPLRCSIGDGLFRETASLLRLRVTFSKKRIAPIAILSRYVLQYFTCIWYVQLKLRSLFHKYLSRVPVERIYHNIMTEEGTFRK